MGHDKNDELRASREEQEERREVLRDGEYEAGKSDSIGSQDDRSKDAGGLD